MPQDAESQIRDLEAERLAAMAAADVETLRRLLHDDLVTPTPAATPTPRTRSCSACRAGPCATCDST